MSDSPVVVVATFTAAAGRLAELRAALVEAIAGVHAERGCLLYAIHDAPDDQIIMVEKWTNESDLDEHGSGAAVARLGQLIDGLTVGPAQVIRMFPIPAGSALQGLL